MLEEDIDDWGGESGEVPYVKQKHTVFTTYRLINKKYKRIDRQAFQSTEDV